MPQQAVSGENSIQRSLLFGLTALTLDAVEEWQFVDAWQSARSRPEVDLSTWLIQRGWLSDRDRAEIERVIEKKLSKHEGSEKAVLVELLANRPSTALNNALREGPASDRKLVAGLLTGLTLRGKIRVGLAGGLGAGAISVLLVGALGAVAILMLILSEVRQDEPRYTYAPAPAPPPAVVGRAGVPVAPSPMFDGNDLDYSYVEGLYNVYILQPVVLEQIAKDAASGPERKKKLLKMAKDLPRDPNMLNNAGWGIVAKPGKDKGEYQRALLMAREAVRLSPEAGYFVNTEGVALFRLGEYEAALQTLLRSNQMNEAQSQGAHPADTCFIAMAYWKLGQKEKAKEMLARSKTLVSLPMWKAQESTDFLAEAVTMIEAPESPKQ